MTWTRMDLFFPFSRRLNLTVPFPYGPGPGEGGSLGTAIAPRGLKGTQTITPAFVGG